MDEQLMWEMMLRQRGGGGGGMPFGLGFGSSATTWLSVAFLIGLLIAAAFRPQNIASQGLFRTAVILFGMYLIVPSVARQLITLPFLMDNTRPGMGGGRDGVMILLLLGLIDMLGTVAQGAAIICGLTCFRLGAPPPSPTQRSFPPPSEVQRPIPPDSDD